MFLRTYVRTGQSSTSETRSVRKPTDNADNVDQLKTAIA